MEREHSNADDEILPLHARVRVWHPRPLAISKVENQTVPIAMDRAALSRGLARTCSSDDRGPVDT